MEENEGRRALGGVGPFFHFTPDGRGRDESYKFRMR